MKPLFVLITIFFVGCATHAPMSEMVMFNIERDCATDSLAKYTNCATDSLAKYTNFGIGLQYSNNGPFEEEYDKKNEQDYLGVEDSYSEGVALSTYVLDEDRFGFGYAIGLANGLDITAKINGDYYGTVSLSSTASFTTIFQRRFVVNESKGVSAGIYLSRGAQSYYSKCRDCFQIAPDEYTSLYHAGLRSVLLFRNPDKGGSGFTGSVNAGYIFEINEPYLGFSVAFLTF